MRKKERNNKQMKNLADFPNVFVLLIILIIICKFTINSIIEKSVLFDLWWIFGIMNDRRRENCKIIGIFNIKLLGLKSKVFDNLYLCEFSSKNKNK